MRSGGAGRRGIVAAALAALAAWAWGRRAMAAAGMPETGMEAAGRAVPTGDPGRLTREVRRMMRQDPDVVRIGEARDPAGMEAAFGVRRDLLASLAEAASGEPGWTPWAFRGRHGGIDCTGAACPMAAIRPGRGRAAHARADRATRRTVRVPWRDIRAAEAAGRGGAEDGPPGTS